MVKGVMLPMIWQVLIWGLGWKRWRVGCRDSPLEAFFPGLKYLLAIG